MLEHRVGPAGAAHNDANVLSLGQRLVPWERALKIVQVWLDTPFDAGRHARRVAMIDEPKEAMPPEATA